jgi:hypothetical protein
MRPFCGDLLRCEAVKFFGNGKAAVVTHLAVSAPSGDGTRVSCQTPSDRKHMAVSLHPVVTHVPPTVYTDSWPCDIKETASVEVAI